MEKCTSQLEFISKGDIIRAKNLDSTSPDESIYLGDADESPCCSSGPPGENWTSLQFSEAMSVLRKFLAPKYKKCKNCGRVSPRISKPTFGWFHVVNSSCLTSHYLKLFSEIKYHDDLKDVFLSLLGSHGML